MHPPEPSYGPIRSPRGLVDATVNVDELVLVHRDSWRDWIDSDWVRGGLVLTAILLAVGAAFTSGAVRVVFLTLAAVALAVVVVIVLIEIVATIWAVGAGVVMLFTRGGRARMRRGAADLVTSFGNADQAWRLPRRQVLAVAPIEGGRRPLLRVATTSGEVRLRASSRHRAQLEALAWALTPR